jgi:hypothetical protein
MKLIYCVVILLLSMTFVIGLWSLTYPDKPVRIPAKSKIVDWDEWYQKRSANLKDDIARSHYSGSGPITPDTADLYLEAFEKDKWLLYSELLPIDEYRKVTQHFLDKFPIINLNSRLGYEDRKGVRIKHSRKHKYRLASVDKQLHKNWNNEYYEQSAQERLLEIPIPDVKWVRRGRHQRALEILHRDRLEAFAEQDSFGFERIPDISMRDLYIQEREPACITPQTSPLTQQIPTQPLSDEQRAELKEFPREMHSVNYFIFGADLAYVPEFRKARGYVPHSLSGTTVPSSLHLKSLELVSLLKYDIPKVYVSDHFPDMRLLAKAQTRHLDSFETSALARLYEGEFVVVDESPQHLQVLGAVHAGETCVECHSVKKGELLGAFSYKFDRTVTWTLTRNP